MTNPHPDTHATSRTLLADSRVDHDHVLELVRTALAEDLAWGPDVTTEATIAGDAHGTAHVVARAPGTIAGLGVAAAVPEVLWEIADQSLPAVRVTALGRDGDHVMPGDAVLELTGPLRLLLTAERTLLNVLCQLSGVATETARWVQALQSVPGPHPGRTRVSVRDTRKTLPGLRVLQKYAVRCGGGVNYRMGLGDAALIKDNHVAASGSITAALRAVRDRAPGITLEVECDTLAQVTEALTAGADLILLDNMTTAEIRAAVGLTYGYNAKLEASGGLSLDRAAEIAATGVDYIAVGALTHSAPALDLGLDLVAHAATTPERVHPAAHTPRAGPRESTPPQQRQPAQSDAFSIASGCVHDRDDLLHAGWVCRVAQTLVVRRASRVERGQCRRGATAASDVEEDGGWHESLPRTMVDQTIVAPVGSPPNGRSRFAQPIRPFGSSPRGR